MCNSRIIVIPAKLSLRGKMKINNYKVTQNIDTVANVSMVPIHQLQTYNYKRSPGWLSQPDYNHGERTFPYHDLPCHLISVN